MDKITDTKCAKCRREGEKLFLKGERCFMPKCSIVKRNYPPGIHGVKKETRMSSFGKQLREKQKAKRIYRLREKQFKKYFLTAQRKKGNTGEIMQKLLEMRLDNIVYRLGLAKSRDQASQLISHGHILVNDKKVTIRSYQVKVGDKIQVKLISRSLILFQDMIKSTTKQAIPPWLKFDDKNLVGLVMALPEDEILRQSFNVGDIIEFYSR